MSKIPCINDPCKGDSTKLFFAERVTWYGLCPLCVEAFKLGQTYSEVPLLPAYEFVVGPDKVVIRVLLDPTLKKDEWFLIVPQNSTQAEALGRTISLNMISFSEKERRKQETHE